MQIAVLSDIHSNHLALEAAIQYIEERNITHLLFLGDYVSDCAYPEKTMDLLFRLREKYECTFIRGNREEYLLDYRHKVTDGWKIPSTATGSLMYTYNHLREKDLDFFEELHIQGEMVIQGLPKFRYCHGSLELAKGRMIPGSEDTKKTLEGLDCTMLVCGHSHQHGSYEYCGKKLVNAGSLGLPWDHEGKPRLAVLHGNENGWQEEYVALEYRKNKAAGELERSGLRECAGVWPTLVRETLLHGIDRSTECVERAVDLSRRECKNENWQTLDEVYWTRAASELGIKWETVSEEE